NEGFECESEKLLNAVTYSTNLLAGGKNIDIDDVVVSADSIITSFSCNQDIIYPNYSNEPMLSTPLTGNPAGTDSLKCTIKVEEDDKSYLEQQITISVDNNKKCVTNGQPTNIGSNIYASNCTFIAVDKSDTSTDTNKLKDTSNPQIGTKYTATVEGTSLTDQFIVFDRGIFNELTCTHQTIHTSPKEGQSKTTSCTGKFNSNALQEVKDTVNGNTGFLPIEGYYPPGEGYDTKVCSTVPNEDIIKNNQFTCDFIAVEEAEFGEDGLNQLEDTEGDDDGTAYNIHLIPGITTPVTVINNTPQTIDPATMTAFCWDATNSDDTKDPIDNEVLVAKHEINCKATTDTNTTGEGWIKIDANGDKGKCKVIFSNNTEDTCDANISPIYTTGNYKIYIDDTEGDTDPEDTDNTIIVYTEDLPEDEVATDTSLVSLDVNSGGFYVNSPKTSNFSGITISKDTGSTVANITD
ncbi:MAG: hypothetical protein VXZ35_08820, partial [Pseudomonadota bacterium]|nr:hypothetical protein [Pseudomonadota bacterium]